MSELQFFASLDPETVIKEKDRFMVRMFADTQDMGVGVYCRPNFIITAAHCVPADVEYTRHFYQALFTDERSCEIVLMYKNSEDDFAIFFPKGHLFRDAAEVDLSTSSVRRGSPYVAIGYGNNKGWTSYSNIMTTDMLNSLRIGLGSGAFWGDSGGGVFSLRTGNFVGIIVSGARNEVCVNTCTSPLAWMVSAIGISHALTACNVTYRAPDCGKPAFLAPVQTPPQSLFPGSLDVSQSRAYPYGSPWHGPQKLCGLPHDSQRLSLELSLRPPREDPQEFYLPSSDQEPSHKQREVRLTGSSSDAGRCMFDNVSGCTINLLYAK